MTATVTFLPGLLPPDQLGPRREAERRRREAGRCPDPKCGQLPPNHLWDCTGDSGPDGDTAA